MLPVQSIALLILLLSLAGCTYLGPNSLQATRPDYNAVIQQTNEQELLLNLVRLRYRDTLYFLSVEKVAASVEFNRGLEVSAELAERGHDLWITGPASVSFSEKPTIFYAPLDGERFARQMMTILNPDMLILLANSGWSIERLLGVVLQEMNGLQNAPTAAGPTPQLEPDYREFHRAIKLLRELQMRKMLSIGMISGKPHNQLEFRFHTEDATKKEVLEFKQLLGLDPGVMNVRVQVGLEHGGKDTINVVPRSLIGIFNYLSQGVVPPEKDIAAGKVTVTRTENGEPFDWQSVLGRLIRIRSSDGQPEDPAVAVKYRGSWFFIADNDLDSKSTFSLLSQLIALQAGPQGGNATPISFSFSR